MHGQFQAAAPHAWIRIAQSQSVLLAERHGHLEITELNKLLHTLSDDGKYVVLVYSTAGDPLVCINSDDIEGRGVGILWLHQVGDDGGQIFGPFFLKFCTYFPYNAKLCLNGHEYVKQQLTRRGIG